MRVGFVGVGTMGNPMARCLLEAGRRLTVYDLRQGATANLCELGATWADSPRAVAQSSRVVFLSLPGPDPGWSRPCWTRMPGYWVAPPSQSSGDPQPTPTRHHVGFPLDNDDTP